MKEMKSGPNAGADVKLKNRRKDERRCILYNDN